ncbi:MAG: UDP-N-acetylmuramate dehydrogenase [Meiothermus sp.]|uniref:UDP-N-acetylmuramate dehydrogenase n=1 Tax=Meiothermus sp. TaxID=1955249 RepID=UPI0025D38422|nr:UDP-N-acetylmuramate dehydrogenase [Meiothermus sp.]MCS7057755.1 UDP-N-acetylmuramate dehydrogenase [Meiothermus sp.]MCS7194482.1 UDP-N-acetylmuramate dehydrogenase [Meiothermus sp.]MCX7739411.1 UDP-N-acetylmuramate dehydrogenase [Meiothermus sp.]MDW8091576.1 UDP-N-acetylmuramate dehydrogenase [Meiothermus sp.]MDW8482314.1 UDP-N-acetylmuramate dehydrogenase [Meiothermus sp.]
MRVERLPMARLTTLGVGGEAEVWTVETLDDLKRATEAPYRVLGNGSNLLVADGGVAERVIRLAGEFAQWNPDLSGWVGAGAMVPSLVQAAARLGLSGLEGLYGVPAQVGGAVKMNAGTRFGEMSGALAEVEIFHDGGLHVYQPHELGFTYRGSRLPEGGIVTRVRLRLSMASPEAVRARIALVDAARKGQPKRKSAGCAFKNPPGDSAGRMIDAAGLKGTTVGRAMISHEHGNFLINLGGATAADMYGLIKKVQAVLPLEVEWEIWGEIEPQAEVVP